MQAPLELFSTQIYRQTIFKVMPSSKKLLQGPSGRHGQNAFMGWGRKWTPTDAIQNWYNEVTKTNRIQQRISQYNLGSTV